MNCLRLQPEVRSLTELALAEYSDNFKKIWLKPILGRLDLRLKPEAIHEETTGALSPSVKSFEDHSTSMACCFVTAFPFRKLVTK